MPIIKRMLKKEILARIKKSPAFKKILKANHVDVVYLFGSQVNRKTTPLSDIDIGIILKDSVAKNKDPAGTYTALEDALKKLIHMPRTRIDIVYLKETSFYFQMNVIKDNIVLYSSSEKVRQDYEEYVMMRYHDWQYTEESFNREMMEAI